MLSEYGRLLQGDPHYAGRAARVSALSRDIAQVMGAESEGLAAALRSAARRQAPAPARVAFHAPCTLQHALKVSGTVEGLLTAAGFALTPVSDRHQDRKSTRLNSSHSQISYAVFCLKKKNKHS